MLYYEYQYDHFFLYDDEKEKSTITCNKKEILLITYEIGIIFDKKEHILYKHGNSFLLKKKFKKLKQKLSEKDADLSNNLSYYQGVFDVNLINSLIQKKISLENFLEKVNYYL